MAITKQRKSSSTSPARSLAMGPGGSVLPPELAEHEAPEASVAEADGHKDNFSEAGSYQSDSFDPALFDEEEIPGGSSPGPQTAKGKYAGGYNAIKSFGGQLYSGMAIGGSHTW